MESELNQTELVIVIERLDQLKIVSVGFRTV